jgi:hypothetical protein
MPVTTFCCLTCMTHTDSFTQYKSQINMHQGLSVTGGGLLLFDTAVVGLNTIRIIFDQAVNDGVLTEYSSLNSDGYTSIDASNRYFTSKQDVSSDGHLQFPKLVDPRGFLASITGHDIVHAPENVVDYYKAMNDRYVITIYYSIND